MFIDSFAFLGVLSAVCAMIDKDSTDKSFVDTFEGIENIEHEPDSDIWWGSIQNI